MKGLVLDLRCYIGYHRAKLSNLYFESLALGARW